MGKIKIIFSCLFGFSIYKGYVAFTDFEIGVEDRVDKIDEIEVIEWPTMITIYLQKF